MVSISFLEAGLRICYWEVLRYDKLPIVRLLLLFKETVDLQGPFFFGFLSFSCQTKHCYFNYSFQENVCKISKQPRAIHKNAFSNKV